MVRAFVFPKDSLLSTQLIKSREGATSFLHRDEVERFDAIAQEWWDPHGAFRPLHVLNPLRLSFILQSLDLPKRTSEHRPLGGMRVLDVGCGGGLLCEPLARLGAHVTGVDASPRTIQVAQQHASDLDIDYQVGTVETLTSVAPFDLILCMEIVEHVPSVPNFLSAVAPHLRPGGRAILSTLNKTWRSFLLGIVAAEYVLRWVPQGTHSWKLFVTPAEMARQLEKVGLTVTSFSGMTFNPFLGRWSLSEDMSVNYFAVAHKKASR